MTRVRPLDRAEAAAVAGAGAGVAREAAVVGRILNLGGITQVVVYVVISYTKYAFNFILVSL